MKKSLKNIPMKKIWMRHDEDEVSTLPLDEDIQTSAPSAYQEENMMSYNPFENFDDALFHDCGNEKNC
jgi:hypothetical protein